MKWRSLEPPGCFLKFVDPAMLENWTRGAVVPTVTKNPTVDVREPPKASADEMGERAKGASIKYYIKGTYVNE